MPALRLSVNIHIFRRRDVLTVLVVGGDARFKMFPVMQDRNQLNGILDNDDLDA
jgi:hypothetical protein